MQQIIELAAKIEAREFAIKQLQFELKNLTEELAKLERVQAMREENKKFLAHMKDLLDNYHLS